MIRPLQLIFNILYVSSIYCCHLPAGRDIKCKDNIFLLNRKMKTKITLSLPLAKNSALCCYSGCNKRRSHAEHGISAYRNSSECGDNKIENCCSPLGFISLLPVCSRMEGYWDNVPERMQWRQIHCQMFVRLRNIQRYHWWWKW